MGMYTEIYVKIEFKSNLPEPVVNALKWLNREYDRTELVDLPDHPFFNLPRAQMVLTCSSYYHQPRATTNLWFDDIGNSWYLCSRADLKNYDGEIDAFFDWVKPHVSASGDRTFIGYYLYEEDDEPTLIYIEGDQ